MLLHAQRVSWICLLLFSSALCFPAIEDYQYPYMSLSDDSPDQQSSEEPAPESTEDEAFAPRSGVQQPAAAPQTENQAPSAAASWTSYQPSTYGVSSASRPARAPQSSAAAFSPGFAAAPASYSGFGSSSAPAAASYSGFGSSSAPAAASYSGFGSSSAPAAASYSGFDAASSGGSDFGPSSAGTLVYSGGAPSFRFSGPASFEYAQLPRVGFESFDPNGWMPSRSFPDFSVWGAEEAAAANVGSKGAKGVQQQEEEEVETFSVPASSYIVQTRNGYQRAREVSSHMNYSPALPEPAVIYYEVKQKAAPQAEPVKGGKGGKH